MDDRFRQAVMVHQILGDPAEGIGEPEPSAYQRRLLRRLVERAHAVSRSLLDQATPAPEPTEALDESIDHELLLPARRTIVNRTVALERWLAEHGFRGGRPLRFVRSHRPLAHHGTSLQLATARPVFRDDFSTADTLLTDRLLDGIHQSPSELGGLQRRPTTQRTGRISVVPGFVLLELSPVEFVRQFGVNHPPERVHVAIGTVVAGPVLVATRDHTGDLLAHALLREYAHELTHLGAYQHRHSLAAPGQLIQSPHYYHGIADSFTDASELDRLAHQLLTERARHLPHDCQLVLNHLTSPVLPAGRQGIGHPPIGGDTSDVAWNRALTLADLGFATSDWVPLVEPYPLDERFVGFARAYLASLLLSRAFVSALNYHPEVLSIAPYFPRHAFANVTCLDDWHPHYAAAHQYRNFVQAAETGQLGAAALDDLYARLIDPVADGLGDHAHHPAVRLHTYPAPLHPSE